MRPSKALLATCAVGAVGALSASAALADQSADTLADYTPFVAFEPFDRSAACSTTFSSSAPFEIPEGYEQQVIAQEPEGATKDLWDMNTQNETGRQVGRYLYRTHEVGAATSDAAFATKGSQVSVTDLTTNQTRVVAQRRDWERFDGIVWTPWGTILAAEETTAAAVRDPQVPNAEAGLVYELYLDPSDPTRLDTSRAGGDGIAARPALGSKSHEGMRFDSRGNLYGISERDGGGIFRFVPTRRGDLSAGRLQVLRSDDGELGVGEWVTLSPRAARINADTEATRLEGNGYFRPEDVETGASTGRDTNNDANTLYVAITGTDEVIAVDLSSATRPFAYQYVGAEAGNVPPGNETGFDTPAFDSPDNLALDRQGNLAIAEDIGGTLTRGNDIWIAEPSSDDGENPGADRQPAAVVERFATLPDCAAEPTGIYFSASRTNRSRRNRRNVVTTPETLFVHRQHAGPGSAPDQEIAITPSPGFEDEQ